jgi:hypothetical protein
MPAAADNKLSVARLKTMRHGKRFVLASRGMGSPQLF